MSKTFTTFALYKSKRAMCISNRIGPPVEGEDFFGREKELRQAKRLLDSKHSLILSAPRRIGKSSLAKRLIAEKKRDGWKCVYIDLEPAKTEKGFLGLIIEAFSKSDIWQHVANDVLQKLTAILNRIEKISVGPVDIRMGKAEEQENLYKNLEELINHDEDTFIVIDELTLFLGELYKTEDGPEEVTFILNWLRSLRQVSQTKVRWMFCGSVGLRNFTESKDLGYTINDLTELPLGELSHSEAKELYRLLCVSEEMNMEEELIDYALDTVQWNIPYLIQVMFSKLSEKYNGSAVTKEDISKSYRELYTENFLNTWSERLIEYQEFEMPARKILKALCINEKGMTRDNLLSVISGDYKTEDAERVDYLLSKLLRMLENDGYIVKEDSLRRMRSPLLRDYWHYTFVE
jgi:AAA+ ATPase superfamily predicted ATPase